VLASILTAYGVLSPPVAADKVAHALTGVHWAFGVAVGFALLAALFASFVRDEDAQATMKARSAPAH
jgi:hypothetical protein